jgi:murein DD-endopeptidase MepM/ murein hydrolase activator NlpD
MDGADLRRRLVIAVVTTLVVTLLPQHAGSAPAAGYVTPAGYVTAAGYVTVPGVVSTAGVVPLAAASGPADPSVAPKSPRWVWPLSPRPSVVERFSAPRSTYGAGHRGVDLAAEVGASVRSVAAGIVSHVGVINGRGTISVLHASGIRSTYEPVAADVAVGEVIEAEHPIGTIESVEGHCAPATCLHLGAIRDRTYLDPLSLLTVPRIILLPPLPE